MKNIHRLLHLSNIWMDNIKQQVPKEAKYKRVISDLSVIITVHVILYGTEGSSEEILEFR